MRTALLESANSMLDSIEEMYSVSTLILGSPNNEASQHLTVWQGGIPQSGYGVSLC